jgi:flagellar biosynthetic protein FlhB
MSGEDQDSSEKEHEASPQKLIEARRKGDIPRPAELMAAAATGGVLLALVWAGGWVVDASGLAGAVLLGQADRLSVLVTTGASAPVAGLLWAFLGPPLLVLALPACLVIGVIVATRSFAVTPDRIAPKLSRISPIATARHKFGPEGLMEFAKGALKLVLVSLVLSLFLAARVEEVLATLSLTPAAGAMVLSRLVIEFLTLILALAVVIGGLDYLWQVHLHRQRNRMSRQELLDEFKNSEGDPHLKAARRERARAVATNRMLADVATADVVVVNPTHFAVALRWDRARGGAPVCVAKGVDEIARVIRDRAAEHGIPLHRDPPTARAIHATVEIGQEIRHEHYRAVAAAIRFADAMRRKARRT